MGRIYFFATGGNEISLLYRAMFLLKLHISQLTAWYIQNKLVKKHMMNVILKVFF